MRFIFHFITKNCHKRKRFIDRIQFSNTHEETRWQIQIFIVLLCVTRSQPKRIQKARFLLSFVKNVQPRENRISHGKWALFSLNCTLVERLGFDCNSSAGTRVTLVPNSVCYPARFWRGARLSLASYFASRCQVRALKFILSATHRLTSSIATCGDEFIEPVNGSIKCFVNFICACYGNYLFCSDRA